MLILGIESSCDETAAALVRGTEVLSDVVHTQVKMHAEYGGVVPELASRDHLRNIRPVVGKALSDAGKTLDDVDAIAVTCRPGLSETAPVMRELAAGACPAPDFSREGICHARLGRRGTGVARARWLLLLPPLRQTRVGPRPERGTSDQ